jgi:uncharacterized protein YwqG
VPGSESGLPLGSRRAAHDDETGPFEEGADAPIGTSRLGGMPDLPADVPWPWRPALPVAYFKEHGECPSPLSFIAQIDFAEIHAAGGLEGFPPSGRLLFFCDPLLVVAQAAEDQTCAAVMFFPEETEPSDRRGFPVEFNHPRTLPAGRIHLQAAPPDPQAMAAAAEPARSGGRRCVCRA